MRHETARVLKGLRPALGRAAGPTSETVVDIAFVLNAFAWVSIGQRARCRKGAPGVSNESSRLIKRMLLSNAYLSRECAASSF